MAAAAGDPAAPGAPLVSHRGTPLVSLRGAPRWESTPDSLCGYSLDLDPRLPPDAPIVAFDWDDTLVRRPHQRRAPGLGWLRAPAELARRAAGCHLVVFTNQGGPKTVAAFCALLGAEMMLHQAELARLGLHVSFFVAGSPRDAGAAAPRQYRKPATRMWDLYLRLSRERLGPRFGAGPRGLFVGDNYDGGDARFAANAGVFFQPPEAFFRGDPPALPPAPAPGVQALLQQARLLALPPAAQGAALPPALPPGPQLFAPGGPPRLVVLCGPPGAGKSSFVALHAADGAAAFQAVSQDALGTRGRCEAAARRTLAAALTWAAAHRDPPPPAGPPPPGSRGVIVDNTNRDRAARKRWVDLAREFGLEAVCVYFPLPRPLALHLNAMRETHPRNPKSVPPVAVNAFYANHEPPSRDEGFAEVYVQPFVYRPARTPPEHFFRWH